MAIKIERMVVKNTPRGRATLLARFDVNLGPLTIKGFELVTVDGSTFVSEPYNLYTPKGETKPKRFTYVFFNEAKGKDMKRQIDEMAKAEYQRRNSAPPQEYGDAYQQQGGGYGQPPQNEYQPQGGYPAQPAPAHPPLGPPPAAPPAPPIADPDDDLPF